jgi:hypothetical protein
MAWRRYPILYTFQAEPKRPHTSDVISLKDVHDLRIENHLVHHCSYSLVTDATGKSPQVWQETRGMGAVKFSGSTLPRISIPPQGMSGVILGL